MIKTIYTGRHFFDELDNEFVTVANGPTYLVDRQRKRLVNVADPNDVLELQQQQFDRHSEVLEHYAASDDPERSLVIDSSPDWIAHLRSL